MTDITQAEALAALDAAQKYRGNERADEYFDKARAFITARSDAEVFGFYLEHKGAEPIFVRPPAYISKSATVTPLFASPPVSNGSSPEFPAATVAAETRPQVNAYAASAAIPSTRG